VAAEFDSAATFLIEEVAEEALGLVYWYSKRDFFFLSF
jgi:hypothetical protein